MFEMLTFLNEYFLKHRRADRKFFSAAIGGLFLIQPVWSTVGADAVAEWEAETEEEILGSLLEEVSSLF